MRYCRLSVDEKVGKKVGDRWVGKKICGWVGGWVGGRAYQVVDRRTDGVNASVHCVFVLAGQEDSSAFLS